MRSNKKTQSDAYTENLQPEEMGDRELLIRLLGCTNIRKHAVRTADALLARFGCYRRILLARHEALLDVEGMTDNAAAMLCLVQNVYRKSMPESADFINTYAGPMSSFIGKLMGHSLEEELWVAGFDELGILRVCECILRGDANSLETNVRLLVEYACRHRLNILSVAHNHPEGSSSGDYDADINVLYLLHSVLRAFHISLQEYIVLDDEMHIYAYSEDPSGDELQQQRSDSTLHQFAHMIAGKPNFQSVEDG